MPRDDHWPQWEDLDQRLVSPKISNLAKTFHKQIADGERRIVHERRESGNSGRYLPEILDLQELLTDEWATALYAVYCETCNQQGGSPSASFIRAVRDKAIIPLIEIRKGTVEGQLSR